MKPPESGHWTIEDVVGFEVAVAKDQDRPWQELEKRDAAIGKTFDWPLGNRAAARRWLEAVREKSEQSEMSEEEIWLKSITLGGRILSVVALLIGGGLAFEFLQYEGSEPVNVSAFFGALILLQAFFASLTLVLLLFPLSAASKLKRSFAMQALSPLLLGLANWISTLLSRRIDGERRQSFLANLGKARGTMSLYGGMFSLSLFGRVQGLAAAFNLGALAASLMAIAFTDIAFGWQSSLALETEQIGKLVEAVALPWSWIWGEGIGYPSLEDIEGSRIVLKDGIRSLSSAHLGSWWPFLVLGVFVYGFIPRVVFVFWSKWMFTRSLRSLDFSHANAQRIVDRMRRSSVEFESVDGQRSDRQRSESPSVASAYSADLAEAQTVQCFASEAVEADGLIDLVGNSLEIGSDRIALFPLAETLFGVPGDFGKAIDRSVDTIVFIFESWMPPIEETKSVVRETRTAIGPRKPIRLLLAGRPNEDRSLLPVNEGDYGIWNRAIAQMGDPYCSVETLKG